MQFPTVNSIIDYLLSRIDLSMEYLYQEHIGNPPRTLQELALTPTEREMILAGLPRELLHPFEPIRGNPSPISPMYLVEYLDQVVTYLAYYILENRYSLGHISSSTITLHDWNKPIQESSQEFNIDPTNPIPTLAYEGLIQQFLQEHGHHNRGESHEAKEFRRLVRQYLLESPLATGSVEDQQILYSQYVDAIFWSDVGLFYGGGVDFSDGLAITDVLYNKRNPNYTGLGDDLDRFHLNWRMLQSVIDYDKDDKTEDEIIADILQIIREALAEEYDRLYAYGTQEYRRLADEWDRRVGRLPPECDRLSYPDLETRVRQILPRLSLDSLCQIVERHQHLLENYEPPCQDYSKDDLIELLLALIPYLPKLELCNILSK